jgi:hypothetical protein
MKLSLGVAVAALLEIACAHQTQVVPFQTNPIAKPTATQPADIGIYRTTHPFEDFSELGLISFSTHSLNLAEVYDHLRQDAAKQGAEAIIDTQTKAEHHTETSLRQVCTPQTTCDASGNCTTTNNCHDETDIEDVRTWIVEGTMIRRKP